MAASNKDPYKREGLGTVYRFWWKIEWLLLHIYGPAQLGDAHDPRVQKEHQRRALQARARAARLGITEAEALRSIPLYSQARKARKQSDPAPPPTA